MSLSKHCLVHEQRRTYIWPEGGKLTINCPILLERWGTWDRIVDAEGSIHDVNKNWASVTKVLKHNSESTACESNAKLGASDVTSLYPHLLGRRFTRREADHIIKEVNLRATKLG